MGIVPPLGHQEIALGTSIPVVYHGGSVMRGVTIHTLFWAPSGFRFSGPPAVGTLSYEQLIQRFFTDAAHDSGTSNNVFSLLAQYPDPRGPGTYGISYDASVDSIDVSDPFPPPSRQCASPAGVATCVTDLQLQQELERVIRARDPSGRGLHDIWFVFLPPDVDTCVSAGECGTTAFAGYHSLSNLGRGPTIYVNVPDPLIELTPSPGEDPQGNPEAESSIDTAAHEAVEAITDPEGTAWMDPNGFEVADKCENPEQGTPLGFAADNSPYNQIINNDRYLIQMMWSNATSGCEQRSTSTSSALPLATVNLRQFSPFVSGNIPSARGGVSVTMAVVRANNLVAIGAGTTNARGNWGPIALQSARGNKLVGVGDDRDQILVEYGASGPKPDLIQTGNGGNPFLESGWTGWFDLDHGYAVRSHSVLLSPCSQTGELGLVVDGSAAPAPVEQCETESDVAPVTTRPLRAGTSLSMSSQDNRAVTLQNPAGALVKLTVGVGEPQSVSAVGNSQILFQPSGFPLCTADLRSQTVRCTGLVARARYTLTRRRGHAVTDTRADEAGGARFDHFPGSPAIAGGDLLTLRNRSNRTLTTLHVAHLRVNLKAAQTTIATGRCEPGDYYGSPIRTPPISAGIGIPGVSGTGTICPLSGRASGLPTAQIVQVDDRSGGQTRTEVPEIQSTAPVQDATLYGPFVALAQTGLQGAHGSIFATRVPVALTITRAASRRQAFHAVNVDTARGVAVRRLSPGSYRATWVLTDANGDTRTIRTQFVQER
jgi:hypothetical protein